MCSCHATCRPKGKLCVMAYNSHGMGTTCSRLTGQRWDIKPLHPTLSCLPLSPFSCLLDDNANPSQTKWKQTKATAATANQPTNKPANQASKQASKQASNQPTHSQQKQRYKSKEQSTTKVAQGTAEQNKAK